MIKPLKELNQLRWKCRRGMLELDILLLRFLENEYSELSQENKLAFEQLLETDDPTLYQWLIGTGLPKDKALKAVVKLVKK